MDMTFAQNLLITIIAALALVLTTYFFFKDHKEKRNNNLLDMINAFYAEELEAMDWISSLTGMNKTTIQKELRSKAEKNPNNKKGIRPHK